MKPGDIFISPRYDVFTDITSENEFQLTAVKEGDILLCIEELSLTKNDFFRNPDFLGRHVVDYHNKIKLLNQSELHLFVTLPCAIALALFAFLGLCGIPFLTSMISSVSACSLGSLFACISLYWDRKDEQLTMISLDVASISTRYCGNSSYFRAYKEFKSKKKIKGYKFLHPNSKTFVWISYLDIRSIQISKALQ